MFPVPIPALPPCPPVIFGLKFICVALENPN